MPKGYPNKKKFKNQNQKQNKPKTGAQRARQKTPDAAAFEQLAGEVALSLQAQFQREAGAAERMALAEAWVAPARTHGLKLMVHVGASAIADAMTLAAHANGLGVAAISAMAPSFFKPATLADLAASLADIAGLVLARPLRPPRPRPPAARAMPNNSPKSSPTSSATPSITTAPTAACR